MKFIYLPLGISILAIGISSFSLLESGRIQREYETARADALYSFADSSGDGIVTSAERDAFHEDFFKGRDVKYISGERPEYADGGEVPLEVLTRWYIDYKAVHE